MGASIWMIFLFPIILIAGVFGNFFTNITGGKQDKIAFPYDKSKGIVWEYDNKDDFYIDLLEVKVEGNEQIFVFEYNGSEYDEVEAQEGKIGCCMDLVFTDKNGNSKTYYADIGDYGVLNFYEESKCLITEYTAVVHDPFENFHWVPGSEIDRVLIQPISYDTEVTFTIVCMPDNIERLEAKEDFAFNLSFRYVNEDGAAIEDVTVVYELTDEKLQVKDEIWTIVHYRESL